MSEIFQWKKTTETNPFLDPPLEAKDVERIWDSAADVLIFTTHLSDSCDIDLPLAILSKVMGAFLDTSYIRQDGRKKWKDMELDMLGNSPFATFGHHRSQRQVCFCLLAEAGRACALFAEHPEMESGMGLPGWSQGDIKALADHLATMCLLLSSLSKFGDQSYSLQRRVAEKLRNNAKKYPARTNSLKYLADRVRDSFAEYTARAKEAEHKQKELSWSTLGRYALIGTGAAFVVYVIGFKHGLRLNFRTEISACV
jgi:hypothetical protein